MSIRPAGPAEGGAGRTYPGDVAEDLLLIWALTEPGEWTNRICHLPL
jgi:hypothetical protein